MRIVETYNDWPVKVSVPKELNYQSGLVTKPISLRPTIKFIGAYPDWPTTPATTNIAPVKNQILELSTPVLPLPDPNCKKPSLDQTVGVVLKPPSKVGVLIAERTTGGNDTSAVLARGKIRATQMENQRIGRVTIMESRPLARKVRALPAQMDPQTALITTLKKDSASMENVGKINDLVARSSQGEGDAFGQLYQIYNERIYNYIYYKTGHSVDAEDLTEHVFIKAWEAVRRFRFEGKPFAAWLFKVARNVVIDHYRTRKNNIDLGEVLGVVAHDGDPEAFAQRRATAQVLMTAISRLTDEQQQVILLKFVDGMDNTEISATMGKRQGAVRALQYRALLALQMILKDQKYGLERLPRKGPERNENEKANTQTALG